jgi:hypothetical protein
VTTNGDAEGSAAEGALTHLTPEEIEAMYPADPDILYSREGDIRGLRRLQAKARARREELARKYPGYLVS